MKTMPLTQGQYAIVDDDDYESLCGHKWHARKDGRTYYAARSVLTGDRQKTILMHRIISRCPDGKEVDHVNGNGLDNRRTNLRICNHVDNNRNRNKARRSSSKYIGVYWSKQEKKWRAQIQCKTGKTHRMTFLGYFIEEEDAAIMYDSAAQIFYGEYAKLNFPLRTS